MPFDAHLDVVVEGEGSHRGCRVWLAGSELRVGDRAVALDRLLGVARRGSVLLVIAEDTAFAIRGETAKLAPLAVELSKDAERIKRNVAAAPGVAGETPVFHTPAALTGRVDSNALRGFALVVALRRALVLVGRAAPVTVEWPRIREFEVKMGAFGPIVLLGGDDVRIELVYLGEAQILALRGLCEREPAPAGRVRPSPAAPAVAPSPRPVPTPRLEPGIPFRVPELSQALTGTSSIEERGLYETARALSGPPLRPDFIEDHLRDVRGVLAAAIARRRQEAASATTFAAAALALDGQALWSEVTHALDAVVTSVHRTYEGLVRRLAAERKLTQRQAEKYILDADAQATFRQQLDRAVSPLQRVCVALAEVSLRIRETSALGGEGLEALHTLWHEALAAFDRAFGQAAIHVGTGVLHWWEEALLPQVRKLVQRKSRGPFGFLRG